VATHATAKEKENKTISKAQESRILEMLLLAPLFSRPGLRKLAKQPQTDKENIS